MTESITYYHIDPAEIREQERREYYGIREEPKPIGATIMDTVKEIMTGYTERWPVRNREPREEISDLKRSLIYCRDDMACWMCGTGDAYVLDHIIPRSAFEPEDIKIADRSDNLACACWNCNDKKSNFRRPGKKRLGVVQRCGDCVRGYGSAPDPARWEDENETCADYYGIDPDDVLQVYCRSCGYMGRVPNLGWVL